MTRPDPDKRDLYCIRVTDGKRFSLTRFSYKDKTIYTAMSVEWKEAGKYEDHIIFKDCITSDEKFDITLDHFESMNYGD